MCTEKKPHKHAEVIKAWADGATIQYRVKSPLKAGDWSNWLDVSTGNNPNYVPGWHLDAEYRIKPEPKSLGRVAFEAFYGSSHAADRATRWENLGQYSKKYWQDAGEAVEKYLKENE